jgi:hypothetical protein
MQRRQTAEQDVMPPQAFTENDTKVVVAGIAST